MKTLIPPNPNPALPSFDAELPALHIPPEVQSLPAAQRESLVGGLRAASRRYARARARVLVDAAASASGKPPRWPGAGLDAAAAYEEVARLQTVLHGLSLLAALEQVERAKAGDDPRPGDTDLLKQHEAWVVFLKSEEA